LSLHEWSPASTVAASAGRPPDRRQRLVLQHSSESRHRIRIEWLHRTSGRTSLATCWDPRRDSWRSLAIGRPADQCANTSRRLPLASSFVPLPLICSRVVAGWFQRRGRVPRGELNYLNIRVAELAEHLSPCLAQIFERRQMGWWVVGYLGLRYVVMRIFSNQQGCAEVWQCPGSSRTRSKRDRLRCWSNCRGQVEEPALFKCDSQARGGQPRLDPVQGCCWPMLASRSTTAPSLFGHAHAPTGSPDTRRLGRVLPSHQRRRHALPQQTATANDTQRYFHPVPSPSLRSIPPATTPPPRSIRSHSQPEPSRAASLSLRDRTRKPAAPSVRVLQAVLVKHIRSGGKAMRILINGSILAARAIAGLTW